MTLGEDGQTDFIRQILTFVAISIGTTGVGCHMGEEIGLNYEYSLGEPEFIAKERGGVSGWKFPERKRRSKGVPAEAHLTGCFAECRPGRSDITRGWWRARNPTIRSGQGDGVFWLN